MDEEWTTEQAARFARIYVRLVEALMREGVPEDVARHEARTTATMLVLYPESDTPEPWED